MDLVEEDLAAHSEQVAHGHRHALLRQDGVDLGLEAGAQVDELAPIADELAQFAQRWWGDPGLGQTSHAEQVDQVRGIALVVFHPPMAPVVAERMGQMDRWPRTLRSRRPPSTTHRSLPISLRGARRPWPARPPGRRGRCRCGPCRASGLPRCGARSRCAAGAGRCRHTVVAVPRESPSVVSGLVWEPQVCSAHLVPGDGRTPAGSSTWLGPEWRLSSRSRDRSSCSACGPLR